MHMLTLRSLEYSVVSALSWHFNVPFQNGYVTNFYCSRQWLCRSGKRWKKSYSNNADSSMSLLKRTLFLKQTSELNEEQKHKILKGSYRRSPLTL